MADWAEKVPDWDERQAVLGLYERQVEAEHALSAALSEAPAVPGLDDKMAEIQEEYERRAADLRDWRERALAEASGEKSWAAQERIYNELRETYEAGPELVLDGDGNVEFCAVSGAPLYEDDITIDVGSSSILASVFVPEDILQQLRDEDEGEDAYEEAA